MRKSGHLLTFSYRYLDDGKVESICMHCLTVVCCSDSADEVMKAQARHICESGMGGLFSRSVFS
jgi:hypothetical protein